MPRTVAAGANGVQGMPPAQRPAEEVLRVALLTEATPPVRRPTARR
jgi:hypothetical protein